MLYVVAENYFFFLPIIKLILYPHCVLIKWFLWLLVTHITRIDPCPIVVLGGYLDLLSCILFSFKNLYIFLLVGCHVVLCSIMFLDYGL